MSTAIELAEQRRVELSYLQTIGQVLADSHFFSDTHNAEQAVAKILAGQEFGMGALEAMRSFHVIDGKVEMSADTQARLVKNSGRYDYAVDEITDEVCQITFYALESERRQIGVSTFSIGDAQKAGIVKADGAWKKYPRNMLFARALTNGVAWFCPDAITGGRIYAPGEVSEEPFTVDSPPEVGWGISDEEAARLSLEAGDGKSADVEPDPVQGQDSEVQGVGKADADSEDEAYGEGATTSDGGGGVPTPPTSDEELRDFRHYLADTYGTSQALMMARELFQTKARKIPNMTVLDIEELQAVDTEFKDRRVVTP